MGNSAVYLDSIDAENELQRRYICNLELELYLIEELNILKTVNHRLICLFYLKHGLDVYVCIFELDELVEQLLVDETAIQINILITAFSALGYGYWSLNLQLLANIETVGDFIDLICIERVQSLEVFNGLQHSYQGVVLLLLELLDESGEDRLELLQEVEANVFCSQTPLGLEELNLNFLADGVVDSDYLLNGNFVWLVELKVPVDET